VAEDANRNLTLKTIVFVAMKILPSLEQELRRLRFNNNRVERDESYIGRPGRAVLLFVNHIEGVDIFLRSSRLP
jgi:hypothetical protein